MRCIERCAVGLSSIGQWLERLLVGEPMSLAEREVSDSIKALKTLEVTQGRVSVDPSEVIGRPGYLDARRRAAVLIHAPRHDSKSKARPSAF